MHVSMQIIPTHLFNLKHNCIRQPMHVIRKTMHFIEVAEHTNCAILLRFRMPKIRSYALVHESSMTWITTLFNLNNFLLMMMVNIKLAIGKTKWAYQPNRLVVIIVNNFLICVWSINIFLAFYSHKIIE